MDSKMFKITELREVSNSKNNITNWASEILYYLGLLIILIGFILSVYFGIKTEFIDLGFTNVKTGVGLKVGLSIFFGSFITGILFLGFSEVIQLLANINYRLYNLDLSLKIDATTLEKEN